MSIYRRAFLSDHRCYFVTTTCYRHQHFLEKSAVKDILYRYLELYCEKFHAGLVAYVLMPNHVHLILYFRKKNNLSAFMRDFKKFTALKVRQWAEAHDDPLLARLLVDPDTPAYKLWTYRFDDIAIRSRKTLSNTMNYLHQNPVKAGLCRNPEDYADSSAGHYLDGRPVRLPLEPFESVV